MGMGCVVDFVLVLRFMGFEVRGFGVRVLGLAFGRNFGFACF